jgi:hypothetical protein
LIGHHDLVATLNRGQEAGDYHLGARQQQDDVLLHPWAGRLGQNRRITIAGIWRRPLT